jgi:hypothetical protein
VLLEFFFLPGSDEGVFNCARTCVHALAGGNQSDPDEGDTSASEEDAVTVYEPASPDKHPQSPDIANEQDIPGSPLQPAEEEVEVSDMVNESEKDEDILFGNNPFARSSLVSTVETNRNFDDNNVLIEYLLGLVSSDPNSPVDRSTLERLIHERLEHLGHNVTTTHRSQRHTSPPRKFRQLQNDGGGDYWYLAASQGLYGDQDHATSVREDTRKWMFNALGEYQLIAAVSHTALWCTRPECFLSVTLFRYLGTPT